jgi:hypothetical protein
MKRFRWPAFAILFALTSGLAVACSDSPTETGDDPLAGLAQRDGSDSVGRPLPAPPATPVAGGFHGTVVGPATPGPGVDTLATAPRISGVVVKAFKVIGGSEAEPELGPVEQTVTTGADGKFALTLTGGSYVVTFTPPANGIYGGVWVTASTSATSDQWPWWVVLWKKN